MGHTQACTYCNLNVRLVLANCFGDIRLSMEVARLELLHEHSVAQPHILFICPSLFVDSNVRLVLASCFGVRAFRME